MGRTASNSASKGPVNYARLSMHLHSELKPSPYLRRSIGAINNQNIIISTLLAIADKVLSSTAGEFLYNDPSKLSEFNRTCHWNNSYRERQNGRQLLPLLAGMSDFANQQCGRHDVRVGANVGFWFLGL